MQIGDRVEEDQQLADMMTDKATVEMESPVAGVVKKLAGDVGDQIAIGSVLVEIETEGADTAAAPAEAEEVPLADGAAVPTQAQEEANPTLEVESAPEIVRPERSAERAVEGRSPEPQQERGSTSLSTNEDPGSHSRPILTTPAVRARARDLGIDLGQVKHSGEHIRHADLDAYLLYNGGHVSGRATGALRADEQIKVVGLRRKIAENMQAAKRRIPHFALVEEYDVTALEETRAMMNRDRGQNPKLTLLPFLITALNKALADFSMINATYDDEANVITRHGSVHMGMAAQTPNGLMVPVIRNAERLSIWQLATEVARLSDAAKTGKATRDELSNPTFTISSLGPMGGVVSTPVISPPQVATIAVNKVEDKVVPVNGELEIRKRMNLSLSCDHRVVDGWDAASFLQALKPLIENPLRLLA